MHSFSCKSLGVSLDVNIYSGFLHLNKADAAINHNDSDSEVTDPLITTENNELSLLIRQHVERFRAEYSETGFSSETGTMHIKSQEERSTKMFRVSKVSNDMVDYKVSEKLLKSQKETFEASCLILSEENLQSTTSINDKTDGNRLAISQAVSKSNKSNTNKNF